MAEQAKLLARLPDQAHVGGDALQGRKGPAQHGTAAQQRHGTAVAAPAGSEGGGSDGGQHAAAAMQRDLWSCLDCPLLHREAWGP